MDICITLFRKTLKGHVLISLSTASEHPGTGPRLRLPACRASQAAVQDHSPGRARLCPSCEKTPIRMGQGTRACSVLAQKRGCYSWVGMKAVWEGKQTLQKRSMRRNSGAASHRRQMFHHGQESRATTHNGCAIAPNVPAAPSSPPASITSTLHGTAELGSLSIPQHPSPLAGGQGTEQKGLGSRQAHSAAATTSACYQQFSSQIQSRAPQELLGSKLTPSQPKAGWASTSGQERPS